MMGMWRITIWFSWDWWSYLLRKPDNEDFCGFWERFFCRAKGHPKGMIFYNPMGSEPDGRCKICGDYLDQLAKQGIEGREMFEWMVKWFGLVGFFTTIVILIFGFYWGFIGIGYLFQTGKDMAKKKKKQDGLVNKNSQGDGMNLRCQRCGSIAQKEYYAQDGGNRIIFKLYMGKIKRGRVYPILNCFCFRCLKYLFKRIKPFKDDK